MEQNDLKVLMISSDRNIFVENSQVSLRMKEYAKLVGELHIVVLSTSSHGLKDKELDKNLFVYPTNSFSKWMYPFNAGNVGKRIVFEKNFVRGKSVITTQDPFECGLAGLYIKNKWRIPLEVQVHTDPTSKYFNGFLNNLRKRISKKVIKNADTVRVVNKFVGEEIIKIYSKDPKTVTTLPIYIDRKRIEDAHVTFDLHQRYGWNFILLSVARLTEEKNLGLALEVLKRVNVYFPNTGLVIAGSGSEENKLKKLAMSLGVNKSVAFVGWQEDLASYYHSANLFLQTSFFEGYGLALVEAGISGLPIVSTPVGIANDLENGKDLYICPQNDPDFMFKAVYDLIENNIKRDSLKINMKHSLNAQLISKEDYLLKLQKAWADTALKVNA